MSVLANRYLLIVTMLFIIIINFSMVLNSNHLYQFLDIKIDNVGIKRKDEDKKKSNQSIHSRDVVIDHEQSKLQFHLTAKNLILAFFG